METVPVRAFVALALSYISMIALLVVAVWVLSEPLSQWGKPWWFGVFVSIPLAGLLFWQLAHAIHFSYELTSQGVKLHALAGDQHISSERIVEANVLRDPVELCFELGSLQLTVRKPFDDVTEKISLPSLDLGEAQNLQSKLTASIS